MGDAQIIYSDRWGDVVDRPTEDLVEIRWFDTTAEMDGDAFNAFLARYAEQVEACRRGAGFVDAVQFRMDMARMDMGWRDAHIIPRYNAAGMRRFAFHMAPGMPMIGAAPAKEGPAAFPTGYFGTRADALAWLRE